VNFFDHTGEDLKKTAEEHCHNLAGAEDGTAAVSLIVQTLRQFTIYDLQRIGANIRAEVQKLPTGYKIRYLPYAMDLLNKYHELTSAVKDNTTFTIPDKNLWKEYWTCAAEHLMKDEPDTRFGITHPAGKLFYRLIYGYTMLITKKPGHPIGTPFPGGARVTEVKGRILCPIRDKEKDLPEALCNFCPATQDERYR